MNKAHQDADGCGFTSAIGSDETHDAASGKFQINVIEGEMRVPLCHSRELHGEVGHKVSFAKSSSRICVSLRRDAVSRSRSAISLLLRPSKVPIRTTCSRCSLNSRS